MSWNDQSLLCVSRWCWIMSACAWVASNRVSNWYRYSSPYLPVWRASNIMKGQLRKHYYGIAITYYDGMLVITIYSLIFLSYMLILVSQSSIIPPICLLICPVFHSFSIASVSSYFSKHFHCAYAASIVQQVVWSSLGRYVCGRLEVETFDTPSLTSKAAGAWFSAIYPPSHHWHVF